MLFEEIGIVDDFGIIRRILVGEQIVERAA